jgi:hypothetical protein
MPLIERRQCVKSQDFLAKNNPITARAGGKYSATQSLIAIGAPGGWFESLFVYQVFHSLGSAAVTVIIKCE